MKRNQSIIMAIIISIIFIVTLAASFYLYATKNGSDITTISNTSAVLGSTDYGNVIKSGPYGNTSSDIKIAYIVGVHPIEKRSHEAIVVALKEHESSLRYCYYIYQVNVTKNADDYTKGRENGQLLARQYVVPDAVNQHFQLAVDVHQNVGNWAENTFIFSPVSGGKAQKIGMEIANKLPWLTYYVPPNPTSPEYLTTPLNNKGVPSLVYEIYKHDSNQTINGYANEFVTTVDRLDDL